jgi:hypothetical protein
MFSREEASKIKHEFWTTFGKYMSPVLSAEGMKVNWINYHTKLKDVHFRMDAGQKSAVIFIALEHPDLEIQELYFQQFLEFKTLLHSMLEEEWEWQLHVPVPDGKVISRIYRELPDISVFSKEHWPDLISFFKLRIIKLDSFWEDAKYSFDALK